MGYTDKIARSEYNELPIDYSRDVIQGVVTQSAVMSLARRVQMPSHTLSFPALATFPTAYWLNGASRAAEDNAFKQTTTMTWENVLITVAELAVLVPIPDALVQDQLFDILGEVRPRLVEEFGRKIDAAVLWGDDKPQLWTGGAGVGIFDGAVTAGNVVTPATSVPTGNGADTSPDLGQQFGYAAELLALDGFAPSGFVVQPGLEWRLRNMRDTTGQPIYQGISGMDGAQASTLFGRPLFQMNNGIWDANRAVGLIGDWSHAMIGVRQEITFSISDSATITDGSGNVTYSAFQQDGRVLRCVMRVGFATTNPINRMNTNASTRYPFAVVTPTGAPSS